MDADSPPMDEIRKEIARCARCGKCRAVCPTFLASGDETNVARGRINLAEALLDGRAELTPRARGIIEGCYGCMRCVEACPSGVKVDLVVQYLREMAASRRGVPLPARWIFRRVLPVRRRYDALMRLARFSQRFFRRSGRPPLRHLPLLYGGRRHIPPIARRPALRVLPEMSKGRGEIKVSFFLGCLLNYVYPETAASIMRILAFHGVDVIVPRAQLCCGAPVLAGGDAEAARALAARNLECLEADKVDAVVFGCASCALTVQRRYPRLLPGAESCAAKVMDITEFIHTRLGYSNLPIGETATYHDPCHLRWGRGVEEPPREILRQSAGYVEMERAGSCCGLGGTFSLAHYDLSCALGGAKVESILSSGADLVATACPGCMLQLEDQLARRGVKMPVLHVAQVYEMGYLKERPSHAGTAPSMRAGFLTVMK